MKVIMCDLSRTLLFPTNASYTGSLNALHKELSQKANYDFFKHFKINKELIEFLESAKSNISLYIFTTQDIQDHPPLKEELDKVFDGIFSGATLGKAKTDAEAYAQIASSISIDPCEILYVDDNESNIQAAKTAGLATIKFESNKQAIHDITQQLPKQC